jgi:hypothetical protein
MLLVLLVDSMKRVVVVFFCILHCIVCVRCVYGVVYVTLTGLELTGVLTGVRDLYGGNSYIGSTTC